MRVLLAGWFSFDEVIATVGDELGADVVARWLADLGVDHDVAWAPYTERGMDWRDVDPADYTHLVFRALPWFELDVDLYEKPHARRPAQVEAPVRRADLVVGMRLHALVLGLEHSRPVVACDPVDGGARVTSQAAALDRPLVVPVEELTAEALDAALARCLSGEPAGRVHAAGERGRDGNARARAWFEEQLASQTPGRRRDRRSRTLGGPYPRETAGLAARGGPLIELRTPGELDAMRAAGAVVADMLAAVRAAAAPGVRLSQLDEVARAVLADAGATSPFLGYAPLTTTPPFPGVVCLSVNDVALHGIPTPQELEDGDLLSVDAGATLDGWVGDAAVTFPVGTPRPDDLELVATTERALAAGIAAAVVGNRVGDVSAAIGAVGRAGGCGINTDQGGHGVGRSMHEPPSVPNEGRPGRGLPLRAGLVIAIEPWFLAGGSDDYRVAADGWTLYSADGSRAAHVEHTVAVTDDGPRILTLPR